MTDRLVPLADYLSYEEAIRLYQALEEQGVVALVKTCGPPSFPFGDGMYYRLLLNQEDGFLAQPVLEAFSENQAQNKHSPQTCPGCGSVYVGLALNLPLWKKLLYAGTTVYQCQRCRKTFFS